MTELEISIIGNILFPIAGYFIGKYQERKREKLEYANNIIDKLQDYINKLDNNVSKNIIRFTYQSIYQDIELFCKKYNLDFEGGVMRLLIQLYLLTPTPKEPDKKNDAYKATNIVIQLSSFIKYNR